MLADRLLEHPERTGDDVGHRYRPRLRGKRQSLSVDLRPLGLAMLAPRVTEPWLVERTRRCLAILPELADRHLGTGAGELGNYNPVTGRDESASRDHETAKNVLQGSGWAV